MVVAKYPKQKSIIGKKVGETFKFVGIPLTYKIDKIISSEPPKSDKVPPISTKPMEAKSVAKNPPPTEKKLSLKEYFESKGFFTIDCRGWNGCLWVLGEKKKLEPYYMVLLVLMVRANSPTINLHGGQNRTNKQ